MLNVSLLKNCVLVRIKLSGFGNSRKVEVTPEIAEKTLGPRPYDLTDDDWKKKIAEAQARLRANKKLIVAKELEAVEGFINGAKNMLLARYCNPSFLDDGLYAVRQSVVPNLIEDIKTTEQKLRDELIPALVAVYPGKVEEARRLWNGSFREKDYPPVEKLADCFRIKYRIVQLDVPEGLPPEIRQEEEKKLRAEFEKARLQIVEALWVEFQKLVNHVVDRLTPDAEGKAKTFQKGTIENIQGFIEAFGNRNAFNDERLAGAVAQAKTILAGLGDTGSESMAQRLRDFEGVREKTVQAFSALKTEVDKGITELPGRSFDFAE